MIAVFVKSKETVHHGGLSGILKALAAVRQVSEHCRKSDVFFVRQIEHSCGHSVISDADRVDTARMIGKFESRKPIAVFCFDFSRNRK